MTSWRPPGSIFEAPRLDFRGSGVIFLASSHVFGIGIATSYLMPRTPRTPRTPRAENTSPKGQAPKGGAAVVPPWGFAIKYLDFLSKSGHGGAKKYLIANPQGGPPPPHPLGPGLLGKYTWLWAFLAFVAFLALKYVVAIPMPKNV